MKWYSGPSPRGAPSRDISGLEIISPAPDISGKSIPSQSASSSPVKSNLASKHKFTRGASVAVPDRDIIYSSYTSIYLKLYFLFACLYV